MLYLGWTICVLVAVQLLLNLIRWSFAWFAERHVQRLRIDQARYEVERLRAAEPPVKPSTLAWEGFRKFRVSKKVAECADCHSFYLTPHDGKSLPDYIPGQYVTLQVRLPGTWRTLNRCYSLSDAFSPDHFRCTVKKVRPRPEHVSDGSVSVSAYLNDSVQEGEIVDLKAPRGHFCLNPGRSQPLVLIAGGIGVTPLFAMLQTVIQEGLRREVFFLLGVRNSREHPFRGALQAARRSGVKMHVCYSAPLNSDRIGDDYDSPGRVNLELIRQLLPSHNYQFYICGPGGMMRELSEGLRQWGVPAESIHSEAFGPSSLSTNAPANGSGGELPGSAAVHVRFDRSGKSVCWDPQFQSLLDLADSVGVPIDAGCRAGSCGTCATAVKSGAVYCIRKADAATEAGVCLPCISIPSSDLSLDA